MADERTPNEDPTEPLRPVSGADARDSDSGAGAAGDAPTEAYDAVGAGDAGDAPTESYDAVDAGDAPTRAFTRPLDQPGAVPPIAPTPPPPTAPTEMFRPAGVGAAAGVGVGVGAGAAAGSFPRSSAPIGAGAAAGPAPAPAVTGSRRLSGGAIALIALAVILLIALVVLILALLNRDDAPAPVASDTPSASSSPSETPSPSPTPTESSAAPEPAPAPTFTVFQAESTANCPDESGSVPLFWSWSIDGATTAWFGVGTDDARAEPFEEVPTTATYEFAYQCSEESQLYTVSAENADGLVTHQTVEVVRLLP